MNCDSWMNLHLKEVICTSPDGERFWKMPECFIRGFNIKYLRIADSVMDKALEETKKDQAYRQQMNQRKSGGGGSSGSFSQKSSGSGHQQPYYPNRREYSNSSNYSGRRY